MAAYTVFETGHTFGPSMLYPVYRSVMNTNRHKSGAQKRKIKEEKDKKSKKGQKSLESCIKFMKPSEANNNKEKVNL